MFVVERKRSDINCIIPYLIHHSLLALLPTRESVEDTTYPALSLQLQSGRLIGITLPHLTHRPSSAKRQRDEDDAVDISFIP
jgi:hypothetical protein